VTGAMGTSYPGMSRREFLILAGAACCAGAAHVWGAEGMKTGERVVIDGVDRFRVREPNFEGVRIVPCSSTSARL